MIGWCLVPWINCFFLEPLNDAPELFISPHGFGFELDPTGCMGGRRDCLSGGREGVGLMSGSAVMVPVPPSASVPIRAATPSSASSSPSPSPSGSRCGTSGSPLWRGGIQARNPCTSLPGPLCSFPPVIFISLVCFRPPTSTAGVRLRWEAKNKFT